VWYMEKKPESLFFPSRYMNTIVVLMKYNFSKKGFDDFELQSTCVEERSASL